ncbi:hypothetical protein J3E74DRAFT_462654 [Bipolaris maydis]|nr:hypothetical protein J3E74DRAFT_462654 [Bipolaris maydis]
MARLSGLPSEHHHEGPGDAPRRKRGRPSTKFQTPSEDMSSSGKRTASPSAELSQTKRTKRIAVEDDEDQIAHEIQQSFSRSQQGDNINVETQSSHTTRRHARRHSEPPVAVDEDEDEDELMAPQASTQPLPGLTPHLDRVGAARKRFVNIRRSRMSMPAQLHIERVDEVDENNSNRVQFAPLTQVLDSRARRRLRRSHLSQEVNSFEDHQKKDKKLFLELRRQLREQDEKIKDLEYQLEARRLGEIDITDAHADELQVQLDEARQQIDELRASSLYNGDDNEEPVNLSDDEEALVMVDPEDLHMSQDLDMEPIPTGKYASRALEISSQMTLDLTEGEEVMMDKIEDEAIERYERELQQLSKALGESQGALRLITIELQNLRFVEAGASSSDILAELRHGFEDIRAEIEKFFPGTTSGVTNQQLLQKVPQLFGGIFYELKEKITLLKDSQKTEVLLRRQYEGVLDLLGDSEERVKQLESDRTILELEERNATLTNLNDEQEAQLTKQDSDIADLEDENATYKQNVAELEEALEKYRQDLDNVTTAATEFENNHHETIARMEKEHEEAIAALDDLRAAEQEGREMAEAEVEQKNDYIQQLEESIEHMSTLREPAETERDEQIEQVYKHANTIENLTDTVTELKGQLNEYRDNLAAEPNEKIEDLNIRLHDTGIQANELRSKLFQLQQEKEAAISELEEDAEERENELNNQLESESQLREDAEKTIGRLEQQILQLEGDIATLENNLADMTESRNQLEQDRDVQVANLAGQLADLTNKYAALENSTSSTIASLQANIIDLNNQVQRQQSEIEDLIEQVAEKEREKIENLEEDLSNQKAENESYRRENDSLSRRVEAEANELLNIVGAHNDQINSLNAVIRSHEATIKTLQDSSEKRAAEYEELLEDRNNEITEMRLLGDARVETIVLLEAQIEEMKERFRLAEEDTRATIDALTASQRQLQEQNERLADDLKRRNQEALQAVQEMKLKRVEVKTQGIAKTSEKVKIGKKGKKKSSRRQWDSGFGVDENVEDDELNGEEQPIAA